MVLAGQVDLSQKSVADQNSSASRSNRHSVAPSSPAVLPKSAKNQPADTLSLMSKVAQMGTFSSQRELIARKFGLKIPEEEKKAGS